MPVQSNSNEILTKSNQQIGSLLKVDENTIVLDICAGAGTIGLSVCTRAKKIVFIECEPSACGMIRRNAKLNGYIKDEQPETELKLDTETEEPAPNTIKSQSTEEEKVEIINKKIEDCIEYITEKYSSMPGVRIVGVVDPPRAGTHKTVVKKLRTFKV